MTNTVASSTASDADFDDMAEIRRLWAEEASLAGRRLALVGAIAARRDATAADDDTALLNCTTVLGAEIAALVAVGKEAGAHMVDLAADARDRIPAVAAALRDGVISLSTFRAIALECAAITDAEIMAAVDAEIATDLRAGGAVSTGSGRDTARRFVAEYDADAVRERRAVRGKGVNVTQDGDGVALTVSAHPEQVLAAAQAIRADAAAQTCADDSRSVGARRADLAIARLTGGAFACDCGNPECPASTSADEIGDRFSRIVVHVVADASTLDGESNKAAWVDGYGVIDAHHARDIAARPGTLIRPLDMSAATARPSDYRPNAAADTAARAVHGTCTVPGCDRAAWSSDLDHVTEFNHHRPEAGGATCPCNLGPKCRLHHLIKTFVDGWLDMQVTDANGVIWTETITPSGHSVRARARNHWLLPGLGLLPCRHGAPVEPGVVDPADAPVRGQSRTAAKHAYRMRLRSRRRYAVACVQAAEAVRKAELECYGTEPPF
ncbi:hypothetical protein nbrc107696_36180 [Gordonia spumicola]|uniref:DUF222 domain-containing protein n=1 Tax=Gordonia spumicola TaxID=589161 RepID=A0A7I9VD91_9ACTN|nr:DUF222 domain-containing protein [Gordonia spumicola]GEE03172.1 hypothetical protein nbrc107696_36180 [Gordonia spumicola]